MAAKKPWRLGDGCSRFIRLTNNLSSVDGTQIFLVSLIALMGIDVLLRVQYRKETRVNPRNPRLFRDKVLVDPVRRSR